MPTINNQFKASYPLTNVFKYVLKSMVWHDRIIVRHTGIAVYFSGQKMAVIKHYTVFCSLVRQKQKAKQKQGDQNSLTAPSQLNKNFVSAIFSNWQEIIETFCFLNRRLFVLLSSVVAQRSKDKIKNKKQTHVSRVLSFTRHLAGNRSQQNHADPLGRGWINPQSQARQPRVALLHQRSSGRNSSFGQRHRLFPRGSRPFQRFKSYRRHQRWSINQSWGQGLALLNFFNFTDMPWFNPTTNQFLLKERFYFV